MKKMFFQIFLPTSSITKTDKTNVEIHVGIIYLREKLCQWSCSRTGFSLEWILQAHTRVGWGEQAHGLVYRTLAISTQPPSQGLRCSRL